MVNGKSVVIQGKVGEELFHTNKEVILSKEFSTDMKFVLTTFYLSFKDLRPSSWFDFSFEAPLIAPVISNAALYWTVSILYLKQELFGCS